MILPRNKLLWLDTEKEMELNIPPQKQGSIRAGIFFEETRKLLLAYPNGVCLMDIGRNKCEFFYPEEYVSDVKIIGDDLYIGIWVKTVIIRNFWNEVAQGAGL